MTVDELAALIEKRNELENEIKKLRARIKQVRAGAGLYATSDGRIVRVQYHGPDDTDVTYSLVKPEGELVRAHGYGDA